SLKLAAAFCLPTDLSADSFDSILVRIFIINKTTLIIQSVTGICNKCLKISRTGRVVRFHQSSVCLLGSSLLKSFFIYYSRFVKPLFFFHKSCLRNRNTL